VAGIVCLPWQSLVVDDMLSERAPGRWACRESGLVVPRQNGKALDAGTPILTANRGWVSLAGIRVGDEVFHPAGYPVAVVAVSDVLLGHECYRVTTTDGRSVVADADHLWTVTDKRRERSAGPRGERRRWFEARTVTTADMLAGGLSRHPGGGRTSVTDGKTYATNEYRFQLPTQEPLKSPVVDLPIDPYMFGAWLGDGDSRGAALTVGGEDLGHMVAQVEAAGYRVVSRVRNTCNTAWHLRFNTTDGRPGGRTGMQPLLRALGVLGDKHIPDVYLTAGAAQREALLQGLLDTDGTIEARRGQVEFCSTTRALADGVLFLARSLGWRATLVEHRATLNGRDCGPKFRVCWTPTRLDPFVPFRMPRKAARVKAVDGGKGRATLSVARIEPVPSVPVRCITVDSPDGLYLAGRDLVPTHNSVIAVIRILAGLYVFGEQLIVYTAHQVGTAKEIFLRLVQCVEDTPALRRRLKGVSHARGDEAIKLRDPPQRLLVKARSKESIRGFSADVLILDEAQMGLSEDEMAALGPTQRARPNPQLVYMGTPPIDRGTYWAKVRRRALASDGAGRIGWHEWSPPPGYVRTDREVWRSTNPSWGVLLGEDDVEHDLSTLGDRFDAEALGAWPLEPDDGWLVIGKPEWEAAHDPLSRPVDPVCFAFDTNPERTWSSISVGAAGAGGWQHGEVVDRRPGVTWMVDRVVELNTKWRPSQWLADASGPAGALADDVEAAGITVRRVNRPELGRACGRVFDAIAGEHAELRNLKWAGNAEYVRALSAAVRGAARRDLGDGAWAWHRMTSEVDISPLVSFTLALHGHATAPPLTPFFATWR
jgi:hypothetical protein